MIDTKELRRKLRSDDPIDHIDIHANVKPVLTELLDRLEAVEKERDSYKFAFSEYSEKTEWVQQGINDGTVSAKYLCWHRADVMSDLLRAAEKERDALRAKIEAMERQEPVATVRINAINGNPSVDFVPGHHYLHHNDRLYLAPGAQPAPSVPEGWKLVPTAESRHPGIYKMLGALHAIDNTRGASEWESYAAMLAAAPEAKT